MAIRKTLRPPPYPPAPRAWQRMLSGRRLDLLDPSPLDIEIEDIAHGLARVARWNGQTDGPHIFSVAQHSLLVETIARARVRTRPPPSPRRAAARCARIRHRRHDLAVQGDHRRQLQVGRSAAARGDPSALRPAAGAARRPHRADQGRRSRRRLSRGHAACGICHGRGEEILRPAAEILRRDRARLSHALAGRHRGTALSRPLRQARGAIDAFAPRLVALYTPRNTSTRFWFR